MEKLGNVQAGPQTGMRQAQAAAVEPKDDFIKLLQQKTGGSVQSETTKDVKNKKSSESQSKDVEEKAVEKPETEEEELIPQEDLQLELQQNVLLQTIVQIAEPEMETVIPEASVPAELELVAVKEEGQPMVENVVPMETAPVEEQPKAEILQPMQKSESTEKPERAAAAVEQSISPKEQLTQAPAMQGQEENLEKDTMTKESSVMPRSEKETTQNAESTFKEAAPIVNESSSQSVHTVQDNGQAERTQDVLSAGAHSEEHTVKSTMENLPRELGKALAGGNTGDSRTLMVELEPASLGKLTIRLTYEAGRAAVSVMATNPRTLELLNEKATEIASILKERTGEETVIYTQEPQREQGEDAQEQNGQGGQQQERQQHQEEKQQHTESFMQQLRLGLV